MSEKKTTLKQKEIKVESSSDEESDNESNNESDSSLKKKNINECKQVITKVTIKLPATRFQGSKRKIIDKIYDIILNNFKSKPLNILDLFGGSGICSLFFALNNINIIYNDILKFNSINAYGFLHDNIENIPTKYEIESIFIKKKNLEYNTFITDTFKDIYYIDKENSQLDIFRENIKYYDNENKKNIMYYLLFQSLISKRPYNLFHRKNLHMRTADVKRGFGNKTTWDKTLITHMLKFRNELINLYKQKNSNPKGKCCIINSPYNDIPDKFVYAVDTVYIDPPYFKTNHKNSQYFDQYHFLEGFVDNEWKMKIDYSSKHLKLKTTDSNVIVSAKQMFDTIINKFSDKNLVISYNTTSFPTISDIEKMLNKKYKKVIVTYIDYNYALSKKKSKEVLILALVS
jgi:adenine-specific DNA-methyltransferase